MQAAAGYFTFSCRFQRAVLAALCGAGGGSCHFFNVRYKQLCLVQNQSIEMMFICLFISLNVAYLPICVKLWLVVGMTK